MSFKVTFQMHEKASQVLNQVINSAQLQCALALICQVLFSLQTDVDWVYRHLFLFNIPPPYIFFQTDIIEAYFFQNARGITMMRNKCRYIVQNYILWTNIQKVIHKIYSHLLETNYQISYILLIKKFEVYYYSQVKVSLVYQLKIKRSFQINYAKCWQIIFKLF